MKKFMIAFFSADCMLTRAMKRVDMWRFFARTLDPYPLIRPFLFLMDPEDAHEVTIEMLAHGWGPRFYDGEDAYEGDDKALAMDLWGLHFPNVLGLGAGLDKQATCMDAFMGFGFGSIEIGTVTPLPQDGNPRPRMFRIPSQKGLINRFGFNSIGAELFAERMKAWRAREDRTRHPVGINIGKNKETEEDAVDYVKGFNKIAAYADYITINVSSPNTPGLRDLQSRERMASLIKAVTDVRDEKYPALPVLIKIAPDLDDAALQDIAAVVLESKVQGVILTNTTLARPDVVPAELSKEAGGLSGPLLMEASTKMLSRFYQLTEGKVTLIGCGGVSSGADAYAKLRAGASLVQVYTALVYEGPLGIQKIKKELLALLKRDGFSCAAEAVGADHK